MKELVVVVIGGIGQINGELVGEMIIGVIEKMQG